MKACSPSSHGGWTPRSYCWCNAGPRHSQYLVCVDGPGERCLQHSLVSPKEVKQGLGGGVMSFCFFSKCNLKSLKHHCSIQFLFSGIRDITLTREPRFVNVDHFLLLSNYHVIFSGKMFILLPSEFHTPRCCIKIGDPLCWWYFFKICNITSMWALMKCSVRPR